MKDVEFRDGTRSVPDHVATMLEGLPTHTLTYEEGVQYMNENQLRKHLDKVQARVIASHFRVNK